MLHEIVPFFQFFCSANKNIKFDWEICQLFLCFWFLWLLLERKILRSYNYPLLIVNCQLSIVNFSKISTEKYQVRSLFCIYFCRRNNIIRC